MIISKQCNKCGSTFQYDPWTDDHELCPSCLHDAKPDVAPTSDRLTNTPINPPDKRALERQKVAAPRMKEVVEEVYSGPETEIVAVPVETTKTKEPRPLHSESAQSPVNTVEPIAAEEKTPNELLTRYIDKSRVILNEFRQADFRGEILSHDQKSAKAMLRNSTFWIAMFMGVLPLLVSAFSEGERTLYGLLFFFAIMWAGIFKGFILGSVAPMKLPVAAFFFTGIIGIGGLLLYHEYLPNFYLNMNRSSSHALSLMGFIIQTGLNEEICKLIPVVLYIAIKRQNWSVEEALLIGVFSGLGFAAFENIHYALSFAEQSASNVYSSIYRDTAAARAYHGTISSMTYIMIRSLSCLFGHAVYTGIATCFVIAGVLVSKGRIVKYTLALAIPATIHGCYNWLTSRFQLGSGLINAAAFALFFGYLLRTRRMAIELNRDEPYVEEVEGEM